jgi:hypothetical protein
MKMSITRGRARLGSLAVFVLLTAACSARQPQDPVLPPPEPLPDSVVWNVDPEIAPLLRRSAFGARELEASERVEMYIGTEEYVRRLATIAEDTTAPAVIRINALALLAHRTAVSELYAFGNAQKSPHERVRMAVVTAMREFMPAAPTTAIAILERALQDPNPRVQAHALEILSDRDVDALRDYHARATNRELRGVALDLIRTAEDRGAPLVARDTTGVLERTTSTGVVITFRPTQRWPQWNAAAGELFMRVPNSKQAVRVAQNVEVVNNVIPAFVTSDTSALVYEVNREIHVLSLRDNTDRKLADGVAPRMLPFSNDVVFLSEIKGGGLATPTDMPHRYQVIRSSLAGNQPAVVGEIKATSRNAVAGGYSPVRWLRIRELNGKFYLVNEEIDEFELPSPFGG